MLTPGGGWGGKREPVGDTVPNVDGSGCDRGEDDDEGCRKDDIWS